MARYVCNRCDDELSDGIDGLCEQCREALAEDEALRDDEWRADVEPFTDAEIERSQALIAHLLGFTEDDLK